MRRNRIRLTESQLHRVIKESVKRVLREDEVRYPKDRTNNPLCSREENDYWNNMVLPSDKEFAQMLDMSKRMNCFMLYKKLGHDKFNAFMVRLLEDNPMEYDEYYSKPSMDYLPF